MILAGAKELCSRLAANRMIFAWFWLPPVRTNGNGRSVNWAKRLAEPASACRTTTRRPQSRQRDCSRFFDSKRWLQGRWPCPQVSGSLIQRELWLPQCHNPVAALCILPSVYCPLSTAYRPLPGLRPWQRLMIRSGPNKAPLALRPIHSDNFI